MASKRTQELDFRSGDGLEVSLLWEPETNRVTVSVYDMKTGDDFEIEVAGHQASDAFNPPYAYAANKGVHVLAGVSVPDYPPVAA